MKQSDHQSPGLEDICSMYDTVLLDTSAIVLPFKPGSVFSKIISNLLKRIKGNWYNPWINSREHADYVHEVSSLFGDNKKSVLVLESGYCDLKNYLKRLEGRKRFEMLRASLGKFLEDLPEESRLKTEMCFPIGDRSRRGILANRFWDLRKKYKINSTDYDLALSSFELSLDRIRNAVVSNNRRLLEFCSYVRDHHLDIGEGYSDTYSLLGSHTSSPKYEPYHVKSKKSFSIEDKQRT